MPWEVNEWGNKQSRPSLLLLNPLLTSVWRSSYSECATNHHRPHIALRHRHSPLSCGNPCTDLVIAASEGPPRYHALPPNPSPLPSLIEGPNGKTGRVIFCYLEIMQKQSLKTSSGYRLTTTCHIFMFYGSMSMSLFRIAFVFIFDL